MNVFISYSVADTALVEKVAAEIKDKATVRYWELSKEPGKDAWATIFKWIDAADLVFVLITDKAMRRAFSVGTEVGHAKKAGKLIIPLVTKDVPNSELGCLASITYITLDPANPTAALQAVQDELEKFKKEMQRKAAEKEQKQKEGIFLLACLAVLAFIFGSKD